MSSYIIAEIGVNHNGSIELAIESIKAAKKAGADCAKFQTFKAEQIVTAASPKAAYQLKVTDSEESQYDMLKKLELNFESFKEIMQACKNEQIDFLSTPYNKEDVDFLEQLGVTMYKIASGQLTELPFLQYVAATKKRIYLSTGMGTMADVFTAAETIRSAGNNDIVVLQCTTNYPSRVEDANITAMKSMQTACKVAVGYSCHIQENYACFAAVALGATVIEKHFTLDKSLPGPDHSSSLEPTDFAALVHGIRQVELSLGNGIKQPSAAEQQNSYGMKRSIVAIKNIRQGEIITEDSIGYKRPQNGLSPNHAPLIIGKTASKDLAKDEPIQFNSVNW